MRWLETDLTGDEIESVAGIAHFPLVSLLSATRAMENALTRVREARTTRALETTDQTSLAEFKRFHRLSRGHAPAAGIHERSGLTGPAELYAGPRPGTSLPKGDKTIAETTPPGCPRSAPSNAAVAILRAFDPTKPKLSLGEIARRTGLDKATVNRLLGTLIGCEMIVQDPVSREYWLGLHVLSLGASVPGQHDLQQIAEPILRDISLQTDCLAFLATFGKSGAHCVARSVIDPPVHVQLWNVGETRPLQSGGRAKIAVRSFAPRTASRVPAT